MATIRKMQSAQSASAGVTSRAVTIAPNGPGSLILIFTGAADPAANLSISDTQGHGWNQLTGPTTTAGDTCSCYYTFSDSPSPTTITVTKDGAAQFMNLLLDEFVGVDQNDPFSASNGGTTGAGPNPSTTVTPQRHRTMLWGACNDAITAVGTGFTKGADDGSTDWTEWKLLGDVTAGVAQTVNFTGTGSYNMVAVALNPSPHPPLRNSLRPRLFRPGNAR